MFVLGLLNERPILFFLAFVGGYIDTATFVGAHEIFSAHVTGNFVVFASQIFSENDGKAYVKLLTFPSFAIGVLFVGYLQKRSSLTLKASLMAMAFLILLTAIGYKIFPDQGSTFLLSLILVTAMGIQNAAHKIFLKGTPTSTVMTGNTTQLFLDLISPAKSPIFSSTVEMIVAFFCGCALSAFLTYHWGLFSVVVPGILSLITALMCNRTSTT